MADEGTMTGVLMPASNHASMPSRTCAAVPKSVVSASQRSWGRQGCGSPWLQERLPRLPFLPRSPPPSSRRGSWTARRSLPATVAGFGGFDVVGDHCGNHVAAFLDRQERGGGRHGGSDGGLTSALAEDSPATPAAAPAFDCSPPPSPALPTRSGRSTARSKADR